MSVESELLHALAKGLKLAAPLLPGVGPTVGRIASKALELGGDFAASGADAVKNIERIQRTDRVLAQMRDDWNQEVRDRFGGSESGPDPYPDD